MFFVDAFGVPRVFCRDCWNSWLLPTHPKLRQTRLLEYGHLGGVMHERNREDRNNFLGR